MYRHTHLLKILRARSSYWKHVRTQENTHICRLSFLYLVCGSLCISSLNIYMLMHRALRIICCKTEDKWHLCDWILICSVIQSHEQNYACNSLIWSLASIIKQKFAYKRCCFLNTYDRKNNEYTNNKSCMNMYMVWWNHYLIFSANPSKAGRLTDGSHWLCETSISRFKPCFTNSGMFGSPRCGPVLPRDSSGRSDCPGSVRAASGSFRTVEAAEERPRGWGRRRARASRADTQVHPISPQPNRDVHLTSHPVTGQMPSALQSIFYGLQLDEFPEKLHTYRGGVWATGLRGGNLTVLHHLWQWNGTPKWKRNGNASKSMSIRFLLGFCLFPGFLQ